MRERETERNREGEGGREDGREERGRTDEGGQRKEDKGGSEGILTFVSIFTRMCNDVGVFQVINDDWNVPFVLLFTSICNDVGVLQVINDDGNAFYAIVSVTAANI